MKFKLREAYEDVNTIQDYSDLIGFVNSTRPLMDIFEFEEILNEFFTWEELGNLLHDAGFIKDEYFNDPEYDAWNEVTEVLPELNLSELINIPELNDVINVSIIPELDRRIKEQQDFEDEFPRGYGEYERWD